MPADKSANSRLVLYRGNEVEFKPRYTHNKDVYLPLGQIELDGNKILGIVWRGRFYVVPGLNNNRRTTR